MVKEIGFVTLIIFLILCMIGNIMSTINTHNRLDNASQVHCYNNGCSVLVNHEDGSRVWLWAPEQNKKLPEKE